MPKEYQATHTVPETGLHAWSEPDGTGAPAATLDPGLDVQVTERRADWARIRCSNGWEAWTDGRNLVATTTVTPPPPPPAAVNAPAPTPVDASPSPHVDSPPVEPVPVPPTQTPAASSDLPWPSPAAPSPPAPKPDPAAEPATMPIAEPATAPATAWTSPAPPRPSPQQTAWATAEAVSVPAPRRFGPAHAIAMIGAAIVIVSAFLPWLDLAGDTVTAYDSPANFLFDSTSNDDGVNLGIVLLILGAVGIIAVLIRPVRWLSIVVGVAAIVIGARYIWQTNDLLSGNDLGLFDLLSYGAYFAIGGGVVAVLGGVLTLRRSA